jgi:NifU-like protein involved in Fe-S cluster formation
MDQREEYWQRQLEEQVESQEYNPTVIDHIEHPRNRGLLDKPDGIGRAGDGDHEYILFHICVKEDAISRIGFDCQGCPPVTAAASVTTELALGKHLDDAAHIAQDTIVSALGGLPEGKRHVAGLAAEFFSPPGTLSTEGIGTRADH